MIHYLVLSAIIFSIGAYGVIARRNLLIVLMSLELMLNGVNVAFITFALNFSVTNPNIAMHGHVMVLVVMAVAAAEVAVGLAIVIALFRTSQTIDTNDLQMLKG